ncbi:MAG: T9SS type A sorting domain-containing protein [Bacteroidales bacterium]|jgi:hypothetical protein|nr:T9SS type A sorting domain-containing protein [Bacteroidales bacterium]
MKKLVSFCMTMLFLGLLLMQGTTKAQSNCGICFTTDASSLTFNGVKGTTDTIELKVFCGDCTPDKRLSIGWEIKANSAVLDNSDLQHTLSQYADVSLKLIYGELGALGQTLQSGEPYTTEFAGTIHEKKVYSDFPGAADQAEGYLNLGYNKLDYLNCQFMATTKMLLVVTWKKTGNYEITLFANERTGGTEFSTLTYDNAHPERCIGGHGSAILTYNAAQLTTDAHQTGTENVTVDFCTTDNGYTYTFPDGKVWHFDTSTYYHADADQNLVDTGWKTAPSIPNTKDTLFNGSYHYTTLINCIEYDSTINLVVVQLNSPDQLQLLVISKANNISDTSVCPGDTAILGFSEAEVTALGGMASYVWAGPNPMPDPSLDISAVTDETITINAPDYPSGTYRFYVTATTNGGCTMIDSIDVTIHAPTLFTYDPTNPHTLLAHDTICSGETAHFTITLDGPQDNFTSQLIWGKDTIAFQNPSDTYPVDSVPTANTTSATPRVDSYIAIVSDKWGCLYYDTAYVSVAALPSLVITEPDTLCRNNANYFRVEVEDTLTNAALFSWSGDVDTVSSAMGAINTITLSQAAGKYTAKVDSATNAFGCKGGTAETFVLIQDTIKVHFDLQTPPVCSGSAYTLAAVPVSGTPTTFTWTPDTDVEDDTVKVASAPAGDASYTVAVTFSDNVCTTIADTIITVYPMPQGDIEVLPTDKKQACHQETVTFWAGVDSASYTYTWTLVKRSNAPATADTIKTFTAQNDTMTYTFLNTTGENVMYDVFVNIISNYGCDTTFVDSIEVYPALVPQIGLTLSTADTLCSGQSVTVTIKGGSDPKYDIIWQHDGTKDTTATFTNVLKDVACDSTILASAIVKDTKTGCQVTLDTNLTFYALPHIEKTSHLTYDTAVCPRDTISLSAASLNKNAACNTYAWKWSNGQEVTGTTQSSVKIETPATAGEYPYNVVAVAKGGCTDTLKFKVLVNPLPTLSLDTNRWLCHATDSIIIGFTGTAPNTAVGLGTLTYAWNNGETGANIYGKPTAHYTVTVTDTYQKAGFNETACAADTGIWVKQYPEITGDFEEDTIIVCYNTDIVVRFVPTTTDALTYVWQAPAAIQPNFTDSVNVTVADDSVAYILKVSSKNPDIFMPSRGTYCSIVDTALVYGIAYPEYELTADPNDSVCVDQTMYLIAADTNTAVFNYGRTITYSWQITYGTAVGASYDSLQVTTNAAVAGYGVVEIEAEGRGTSCSVTDSIPFWVIALPAPVITPDDTVLCFNGGDVTFVVEDANNVAVSYAWKTNYDNNSKTGAFFTVNDKDTVTITRNLGSDNATDSIFVAVSNILGCTVIDTSLFIIAPLPQLPSGISFSTNDTLCVGNSVDVKVDENDPVFESRNTYYWIYKTDSDTSNTLTKPTFTAGPFNTAGIDSLALIAVDSVHGCTDTGYVKIHVMPNPTGTIAIATNDKCAPETGTDFVVFTETVDSEVSANATSITYSWNDVNDYNANGTFVDYNTVANVYSVEVNPLFATVAQKDSAQVKVTVSAVYGNNAVTCVATDSAVAVVKALPQIAGTAVAPDELCALKDTAFIADNAEFTFAWKNDINTDVSTDPAYVINFEEGEDYTAVVTATNTLGCSANDTVKFHANYRVDSVKIIANDRYCDPASALLTAEADEVGTPANAAIDTYAWSANATPATLFADTANATGGTGWYKVTATNFDGCSKESDSVYVIVDPNPYIVVTQQYTDGDTATTGTPYQYTLQVVDDCKNLPCGYYDIAIKATVSNTDSKPTGSITSFQDYVSANRVTYTFGALVQDDYSFNDTYNAYAATSIPTGDGNGQGHQFGANPDWYNFFTLHYIQGRTITVKYTFSEPGDYEIQYVLRSVGGSASVTNVTYTDQEFCGNGYATDKIGGKNGTATELSNVTAATARVHVTGAAIQSPGINPNSIATLHLGEPSVTIYPNPAKNEIQISMDGMEGATTVSIYDITGKVLDQFEANASNRVVKRNVEHFSNGIYFLKVSNNDNVITKKLIITK